MATGSRSELAIGAELSGSEDLLVVERKSLGAAHRLVFAPEVAPGLRAQFAEGRFTPQPSVRDSIEVIARAKHREVVRFRHDDQWFVLKQEAYRVPRVHYGGPFSGPNSEREFHNLRTLRALRVPAVEPLCCGTSGYGPFVRHSLLLTREFSDSIDLRDWTRARDTNVSAAQLQQALLAFAVDLGRVHRARRYAWTLYAKNFLVRPGPAGGAVELALCDMPRLVHWPRKLSVSFAVRDLGALDKWGETNFPLEARLTFLARYLEALGEGPPFLEWCRRIEHRVNRLNHRTSFSSARKRLQRGIRGLVRGRKQGSRS